MNFRFTPRRLDALTLASLVIALLASYLLPQPSPLLVGGFAVQGLLAAAWLMRRAVGNRRSS